MKGLLVATTFLTRVPVRVQLDWPSDLTRSIPWFPVVGAATGATMGLVTWMLAGPLPPIAAGAVGVGVGMLITGGFHEDGLADTFDGLGGSSDRQRALEIMRDSRLGTFGAAALVVALVTKVSLLASFGGVDVVVVAAASGGIGRAVAAGWMRRPARPEGLGADYLAAVGSGVVMAAVAIGLGVGAILGFAALVAVPAGVIGGAIIGIWAHRRIGGVTGDVLGAIVVTSELAVLGAASALQGWLPW